MSGRKESNQTNKQTNKSLISVDYFSKWPEVSMLDNLSAKNVIQYMKGQFSRYGLIDTLVSDNGPQFANAQMRQFAKDYGFTHVTSSPMVKLKEQYGQLKSV